MAARNCEMAPVKSPALRSRRPELVANNAACNVGLFSEFGAGAGFASRARRVSQLAEDSRKRGVGSRKVGLQANGFAQCPSAFLKFGLLL